MPDNKPSVGAQSFMEDGEGDEANCNGGIFVDTGGITINGGFGGGGSGKCSLIELLFEFDLIVNSRRTLFRWRWRRLRRWWWQSGRGLFRWWRIIYQ